MSVKLNWRKSNWRLATYMKIEQLPRTIWSLFETSKTLVLKILCSHPKVHWRNQEVNTTIHTIRTEYSSATKYCSAPFQIVTESKTSLFASEAARLHQTPLLHMCVCSFIRVNMCFMSKAWAIPFQHRTTNQNAVNQTLCKRKRALAPCFTVGSSWPAAHLCPYNAQTHLEHSWGPST